MSRFAKFAALALFAGGALQAPAGWPQGFPSRPVRVIVPASAGGTIDIIARTLSQGMSEGLG